MDKIVVLDFGGQYAHLIANRIRRLGVFSEIADPEMDAGKIRGASGIILSGGPASVYETSAPQLNSEIPELGVPILGICYGHHLLTHQLGGKVTPGDTREYGTATLSTTTHPLFEGMNDQETVWMSHGDTVSALPEGFARIAHTPDCENAAVADDQRKIFGIQFHPEVTHTPNGMKLLENFTKLCGCKREWTAQKYVAQKTEEIRGQVGEKKVFLLASGGVDSTVCLALLNKALGANKVRALHIDNGFMRKDESAAVMEAMRAQGFDNLEIEDASTYFLEKTKGLVDPEEKRKAIGNAFIEVQQRKLKEMRLDEKEWLLGQGTIYPDTIETGRTKHSNVIKTHHNRVEIIQKLIAQGRVIEPLDLLYKDEVRAVGEELGLPESLVWRHPFPGPGLGVRMLCSTGTEKPVPKDVQEKVRGIATWHNLDATVLPLKSVGVQGDHRTYQNPAVLEGKAGWKTLEKASTAITNAISEVNRCAWLVAGKVTQKTQTATLTRERADTLREAEAVVEHNLREAGLYKDVWQFPVVLAPLDVEGDEVVILRPVYSKEAMTARFADLPKEWVEQTAQEIMRIKGVGAVLYDVTHKPPGTIEWE